MKSKTKFCERYSIKVKPLEMSKVQVTITDLVNGEVNTLVWCFTDPVATSVKTGVDVEGEEVK